ncbi:MAG TPA: hypothetical protein PLO37_17735 [Candidatus Hydrogenedentes bacterium]|nr:hypothetical protein [Candidatus Hydrogenedentota bacterium]HPG68691.1 hypothetical protein [Candidatus Hydrogenedentota bacterium]
MKKEHVIVIVMFAVVVAASGAVYQFYFKPQLQIYNQDQERARLLEEKLKQLENTFAGFEPSVIVTQWRFQVQPWTDALFERGAFFDLGDAYAIPEVPDAMMLKFYYQEESQRMLDELAGKIRSSNPPCHYPNPLRFGAPLASDYRHMTKTDVQMGLMLIKFGGALVEMLLDAKAAEIDNVVIWPIRFEYDNLLHVRTAGLSFKMTLPNLAEFVENDVRTARRFFDINAISAQNTQLRSPQDPLLSVQILLTQAGFVPRNAALPEMEEMAAAPGGPGGPGPEGRSPRSRPPRNEGPMGDPTKFDRFLKWLKFNFWPF